MKTANTLTAARLREVVSYDPTTGVFTWLQRLNASRCVVGAPAGRIDYEGYRQIGIDRDCHRACRLAWLYVTGSWPTHHIDHIDGDRSNDAWVNLRDVPNAANCQNRIQAHRRSRSGLLGVSSAPDGRWDAEIMVAGVRHRLGRHDKPQDAQAAYLAAKARLHPHFAAERRPRKAVAGVVE